MVRLSAVHESYRRLRRRLGQAALLGLEVLIVGDIVRTMLVDTTLESAAVLGMIAVMRSCSAFHLNRRATGPGRGTSGVSRSIMATPSRQAAKSPVGKPCFYLVANDLPGPGRRSRSATAMRSRTGRLSLSAVPSVFPAVPPVFPPVLAAVDAVAYDRCSTDHGCCAGDWRANHASASYACWSQWHIILLP